MIFNVSNASGKTKIETVPSVSSSLTYNGKEQSPTWMAYDPEQLTMTGTMSAVNAGTYQVAFTPTKKYKWADGSSEAKFVEWTIAKAAGSLSLSAASGTIYGKYGGTATFTVTRAGDGKISVSSSNTGIATVSISGTTVTVKSVAYGTATITVSVAEGTNHKVPSNKTYAVNVDYLYLSKTGDQCTSVTGGWQAYATSFSDTTPIAPTIIDHGGGYGIKMGEPHNKVPYGGAYVTKSKVSFSGFTKLKFFGSSSGEDNARCMIRVWSQLSSNCDTYKVADYYFPSYGMSNQTVTLDVSGLNGSYYVGIYVYATHWATLVNMWLE